MRAIVRLTRLAAALAALALPAPALLALGGAAPALAAMGASGEPLKVELDQARVLKIDRPAETVIIGNPAIVDVTVHDAETLVLTGRSYGITNLVILDAQGATVVDEAVIVHGSEEGTVRIYRQSQRATFSCAPECEPTMTVGDTPEAFGLAADQFGQRQTMATTGLR